MKKQTAGKAIALLAVSAITVLAGCGKDDSGKVYLDEIRAEDYVKLGEYKGLSVEQALPEVTEEQVDAYINYQLSLNPKDGAKEGDTVNIDYVGTMDGVAFDGGTASGQNLTLGSHRFIEGFEEGLVGAKAGDVVELNLTFPEDYHEGLAGEDVVFMVTVNTIMAATPQELNEEYVKGLEVGCSTVEEYRQYVKDLLMESVTAAYEDEIENSLVSLLMESCEFTKEPPQALVDGYEGILRTNLAAEAANYGMSLEQFMSLAGMDAESYSQEIREQAVRYAKQSIMMQAIADREGLDVSEEELEKEMEEIVADTAYGSLDELKKDVDERRYRESMMAQKVMEMLRENAIVNEG